MSSENNIIIIHVHKSLNAQKASKCTKHECDGTLTYSCSNLNENGIIFPINNKLTKSIKCHQTEDDMASLTHLHVIITYMYHYIPDI